MVFLKFQMKLVKKKEVQYSNDITYHVLILCSFKNDYKKSKIIKNNIGRWSEEEHILFLKYYNIYGKKWKKISNLIKTRNLIQIRSHAQKYFNKIKTLNRKCITTSTTRRSIRIKEF